MENEICFTPHLLFSERIKMEVIFNEWCDLHNVMKAPNSLVALMESMGWLNTEKIKDDLKKVHMVDLAQSPEGGNNPENPES